MYSMEWHTHKREKVSRPAIQPPQIHNNPAKLMPRYKNCNACLKATKSRNPLTLVGNPFQSLVVKYEQKKQVKYDQTSNSDKLNRLGIPANIQQINYWLCTSAAEELNQGLPRTRRWSKKALNSGHHISMLAPDPLGHTVFINLLSSFASTFSLRMAKCAWN